MGRTLAADSPVRLLCKVIDGPSSTYDYQAQEANDVDLRAALEAIAVEHPRYGSRRMNEQLKRSGWQVNRKRVQRLMHEEHLVVQVRRYCRTTNRHHSSGRYPNLVKHLEIVRPNQVWCADLTSIRLPRQFVYLAVVLDIFTRSIRGWELSGNRLEALPTAALERALMQGHPEIHHSDQGVQYAATGYTSLLEAGQVQISMAARGRPTENAFAERFMRTLKQEEVSLNEYEDLVDARAHLTHFLDQVYQQKRIHSSLGYLTPAEFEAHWNAGWIETSGS
jgi:putative transposase